MLTYSLRITYILLYILLASQGIFYLLCLTKALQSISIEAFIEQRKAVDAVIRQPLMILYPVTAAIGLIIVIFNLGLPKSLLFVTSVISLLLLMFDMGLAMKESVPLNQLINQSPVPGSIILENARTRWLQIISLRGTLTVLGLLVLLTGFIGEHFSLIKAKY